MRSTNKIIDHFFLQAIVNDRELRMYKKPVDVRLGMTGLTKLVEKATGESPKITEAYAFKVKNRNLVKVLTRDEISTNLLELYDGNADNFKELVLELGL